MIRAVPILLLAFIALVPSAARAQGTNPLDCKNFTGHWNDPWTRTPVGDPKPDEKQAFKNHLSGEVRIDCDDSQIFADEIDWRDDEQTVSIKGHVLFVQPGVRVMADHAIINRVTKLGTFFDASGYTQIASKPGEQSLFGGLEPDMYFWGDQLIKTGERTYRLIDGGFTSCVQATPRWDMGGTTGSVTLDKHVTLKNAVLHVKDVPLFYVPIMYYPINKEDRATGFLMPKYGSSTVGGFTLSNAFFWAINRSEDATFYHTWFKKTGQSFGTAYRFISMPGSNGDAKFNIIAEREQTAPDGTITTAGSRSYNVAANVNQELPNHFRLLSNVDYFNNATTQQLYQQDIMDISQRTRTVSATVSGVIQRFQINATFQQNDVYSNTSIETASRRGYAPKGTVTFAQKRLGKSRVYFGAAGELAYLERKDNLNDPRTDHSLWRVDGAPQVRVPLSTLPFLTATTTASWRFTEWMESQDPLTGAQISSNLTRQLLTVQTTMTGPVFSRVFNSNNGYAEKIKHLIEPNVTFQYTSPFEDLARVVQNDGTDSVVGGTTQISYGVTNRLLAKRKTAAGPAQAVPILQVDIGQTYYSNALAAPFDPNNWQVGIAPPTNFWPVQITVAAMPTQTITARFVTDIDAQFKVPRSYGLSGSVSERLFQVSGGWIKRRTIPGLAGYNDPAFAQHFLNLVSTVKRPDGRFGGTYAFNYDVQHGTWLQRRLVAFYNSQCCGIQFDYQTADITHLGLANTPSNRHIGISFTLAGIGSFANPLGSPTR
jgi:lipopolysaccharide assembly outer membrane protein LptD (OstA)